MDFQVLWTVPLIPLYIMRGRSILLQHPPSNNTADYSCAMACQHGVELCLYPVGQWLLRCCSWRKGSVRYDRRLWCSSLRMSLSSVFTRSLSLYRVGPYGMSRGLRESRQYDGQMAPLENERSPPQSQQLVTVPECGANHQMKTRAINPLHMPRGAECANGVIYFCLPQVIEHFPPQAWSILLLMAPDIVDSLLLSPD